MNSPTLLCAIIFLVMITSILFFPQIRLGKRFYVDTYWCVTLFGAIFLLVLNFCDISIITDALISNSAINPLKIVALFIAMTILSVFLDELGFFSFLAEKSLRLAGNSRVKLLIALYLIVSVLTVFTSNDIIILTFTPFICYFAKRGKLNPIPYLMAEFVAANTWSMALIIGNPTNIYLATAFGIDFVSYIKVMLLPTIVSGIVSFALIFLVFRKTLKKPLETSPTSTQTLLIKDKVLLIVGLIHLACCTVLLAISSYVGIEMWIVSCIAVVSLTISTIILSAVRRKRPTELLETYKKAPYQLLPFVISMFVIIIVLAQAGFTASISGKLGASFPVLKYGVASFVCSNVINNIPMSVLFSSVIQYADASIRLQATYATIVGSNLGAIFTPIGALAGIMWSSILNKNGFEFNYVDFIKIGGLIGVPTLVATLLALMVII